MTRMTPQEQNKVLGELPFTFSESLKPVELSVFQVNMGRWCNQACAHCHVDASPARTETIGPEVVDRCLELIATTPSIEVVDLTGGAPEGQQEFRRFAEECRKLGKRVIDRCNLTILSEPGFEDLVSWLADQGIEIVASLPHYIPEQLEGQRGKGVCESSMAGLQQLNILGYGTRHPLYLVYNPGDYSLAGNQLSLEQDFRRSLTPIGIEFSGLYALNNMPLGRYLNALVAEGRHQEYMQLLVNSFNPNTLPGLMCRRQISVSWDGKVYDCDFNQMLDLEQPDCRTVFEFDYETWLNRRILTSAHCFGCTAGTGSSCGGNLAPVDYMYGTSKVPASSSESVSMKTISPSVAPPITESMDLEAIQNYYGKILQGSSDLKTDACCTLGDMPLWLKQALTNVHTEVLDRYYGCGLVAPEAIESCTVVDLGCGSGRDLYVIAQLVGAEGTVIGVDMTPEQLEVARKHQQWHAQRHGYSRPNTKIIKGFIEDLSAIEDNSVDIVVSNCVVNLSPDKPRVLSEVHRILKPGGEFYFSDVYADRRLSWDIRNNEILWGECLAGALYWMDFLTLAKSTGFLDPRLVTDRVLNIENPELESMLAPARFWSATWRLFKLDMLEPICEDYGQVVRYRGGVPQHESGFTLDNHHYFEKGQSVKVCTNTWHMLKSTRFAEFFDFWGDESIHFGAFADCGSAAPFSSSHDADESDDNASNCC
ncbi:arsenosugar biosynthesis radical SAM (seleno)protein ArsS [Desulfosediminicola flagellatus]|uniref:arsenosugar biosynthesis radical SAM (seleno)protein ArsS n=1 Tax=Desulfosediminicola flagellatus TaxID=2569541 RepID=UPI0010ADA20A|nr:arsenosugar biosynthesis radical SAM (seleno)protein ArsS [Desulfosediminicola flagellatus]